MPYVAQNLHSKGDAISASAFEVVDGELENGTKLWLTPVVHPFSKESDLFLRPWTPRGRWHPFVRKSVVDFVSVGFDAVE